jgi:glutamine synthetase
VSAAPGNTELQAVDALARDEAIARIGKLIDATGLELVRFAWCDLHGMLRGKTLVASQAAAAMRSGVGMVSTLLLKDTSDRTAYDVFDTASVAGLPDFAGAPNMLLWVDPARFQVLPWVEKTGWVPGQLRDANGQIASLDTRGVLQTALARLAQAGYGLRCGLEIEFHIYKLAAHQPDEIDPHQSAWPGPAPAVSLIHPGYQLLSEQLGDQAEEPLRIVQRSAQALGLPLLSLEIELGPSQVEAVFDVTDALTAADNMVLFRSAVRQALRRAGYHATFMCRPPFPSIMSSGWHLHQSLVDLASGANAFVRGAPAPGSVPDQAEHALSAAGEHYLAGLLAHAAGMTPLCVPTINAYARFQPRALAPQSVVWGLGNRGAMLRVVGGAADPATRIENRIGEPAANPYLYIAAQIHAGLSGLTQQLKAPRASSAPYDPAAEKLPATLGDALHALQRDTAMQAGLGKAFIDSFSHIKKGEIERHACATDKTEWERREYFGRI